MRTVDNNCSVLIYFVAVFDTAGFKAKFNSLDLPVKSFSD